MSEPSEEILKDSFLRNCSAELEGVMCPSRDVSGTNGRVGLLDWARHYLPEHFRLPPSKMHVWLANELDRMCIRRDTKLNVLGPRGGAKSTVVTLAYVLRTALENTEPYIWIISDTRHQATCHLENVRAELDENPRIAANYGNAAEKQSIWSRQAIRLGSGTSIEAFGTGQRIRGRRRRAHRPTLIVCDDLQNDSHMESALQREHSQRWFEGTLLKAGTHTTNIVNVATALHRDALALHLDRTPGWNSRIFRAVEQWPERMSLWHQWEQIYCDLDNPQREAHANAFYAARREAMDEGAELLWPQHEDLYTLMRLRVEGGRTAFEREKQASPINPDLCEWPEVYFAEHIWFDEWPQHLALRIIALDPSKGHDARRGDYSALVQVGLHVSGVCYVQADLARRATPEMIATTVEMCRKFRPLVLAVETNQFQELIGDQLANELRQANLACIQLWSLDNRVNKRVRIRRLGPWLSSRRLRFKARCGSTAMLVRQLQDFPAADHDDGPDALEMALRLAVELSGQGSDADGLGNRLPINVA